MFIRPTKQTVYCDNIDTLKLRISQWIEDGEDILEVDEDKCFFISTVKSNMN